MRTTFFLLFISLFIFSCSEKTNLTKNNDSNNDTISYLQNPLFRLKIANEEVDSCTKFYKSLSIKGLTNKFTLDYNKFYKLMGENYSLYDDCEFHLIQDNGKLNLGLVLKDANNKTKNYIFNVDEFVFDSSNKFSNQKNIFINGINSTIKQKTNPQNKNTSQYISYKMKDILGYLLILEGIKSSDSLVINQLNFDMLLFKDHKGINNVDVNYDNTKKERISFAVSPVINSRPVTFYYDAGDLKP